MITQLCARNFKSWKNTKPLRIAPLTGFFGTNSSGKTSLIQLLLLLKQTAESPDRNRVLNAGDDRSIVDLGTFYDLVYDHKKGLSLDIQIDWRPKSQLIVPNPKEPGKALFEIDKVHFHTAISSSRDTPSVREFSYEFKKYQFGMKRQASSSKVAIGEAPTANEQNQSKGRYDLIHRGLNARRTPGRAWALPPPVKCYGFPDAATGYYQNMGFLPTLVLAFENMLSDVYYLGPLRDYPQRTYVWAGERPTDVGRRGELAVAALLAAHADDLKSGRGTGKSRRYAPIEQRVLEWMQSMGLVHTFSLRPIGKNRRDYEFRIKSSANSAEVLITDVGFGISQVLPVLALCYYVPEGSTIILEQPEIHLHPAVQAALADVLIDVVVERNVQVIVESHSEHLLRRLQRRIAEDELNLSSSDTALYFCHRDDEGLSHAQSLDIDMFGNIRNWPKGFFGDEMGDLAAMTEAIMNRQKKKVVLPHA